MIEPVDLTIEDNFPTTDDAFSQPIDVIDKDILPLVDKVLPFVQTSTSHMHPSRYLKLERHAHDHDTTIEHICLLDHMVEWFTKMNVYHYKSWKRFTHQYSTITNLKKLWKFQVDFVKFTTSYGSHFLHCIAVIIQPFFMIERLVFPFLIRLRPWNLTLSNGNFP